MINILAVENNRQTASRIYSALSDRSRYHLAVVESGYTALEAIGLKAFELIIIDRDLTFLSGFKTAVSLRKRLGNEMSPFVIVGSSFTRNEVEEFIPTGVFDFWHPTVSAQRIRLTADTVAEGWKSDKDNLKNYEEYLKRKG